MATFSKKFRLSVILGLTAAQSLSGATVTAITTDGTPNGSRLDAPANLTSLTTGGVTFSSPQFISISTVINDSATPPDTYRGRAVTPYTDPTVSDAFTDLDVTTGLANAVRLDLYFSTPIQNLNGSAADFALLEIATGAQNDGWSIQAIVGGTTTNPVLGGSAFSFTQSNAGNFGTTGTDVRVTRDGAESLDQTLYGAAYDFSALGINDATPVLGLRVISSGGDPSLVVGLVPEPSSAAALLLGFALGIFRRKR